MHITAQRRGILSRIREKTNVSGIMQEQLFSPEFKEIMDKLRDETDDPVRAIMTGQVSGKAMPPSDGKSLKDILKLARSLFNRREYMQCIAELGKFHKKMADVARILKSFNVNVDKVHHKFLFENIDPETEEYLKTELHPRFKEQKQAEIENQLIKEAGILDFFHNITNDRAKALKAWEKKYPKRIGVLKNQTKYLLDKSDTLLSNSISILKQMANARATRKVDEYISLAGKIIKNYNEYDIVFKKYYKEQVQKFVETQIESTKIPEPTVESEKPKESEIEPVNKPISTEKADTTPSIIDIDETITPSSKSPAGQKVDPSKSKQPSKKTLISPTVPPAKTTVDPTTAPTADTVHVQHTQSREDIDKIIAELRKKISSIQAYPPSTTKGIMSARAKDIAKLEAQIKDLEAARDLLPQKKSHHSFIESLQLLSNEHPYILAKYIYKYAKMIENTDPETSVKLINIVNAIEE